MASGITVEDMLSALQWTRCELQRLQSLVTLLDVSDGDKHSSAPLGEASRAQSHADVEQQSPDSRVKRVALASDGGDEPSAAESGYRASSSARDVEGVAAGSGVLMHASSATDMTRSERTRGDEDARVAHSQPGAVQGQHSLQEGGQGVPRRTLGVDNEDHVEVGESQERQDVCLHSTSNDQMCAQEQSDVREDELSSHATRAMADNLLDTRTKRMPLASPVSPQLASPAENQWLVQAKDFRDALEFLVVKHMQLQARDDRLEALEAQNALQAARIVELETRAQQLATENQRLHSTTCSMLAELSRAHEQEADEVSRVAAFAASLQTENETLRHLLVKVTDEDGAVTDPIPIDTSTAARWLPKRRARGGPPAVPEVDRAWAAAQSAMGTRIVSPPSAVRKLSLARTLSPTQAGPGSPLGARGLLSPVRLPPPTYSVPSARTGLEVRPLAVSPSASVGLSGSGDGALPLVPPPKLLATSLVRRSLSTGSEPLDIDIPLSPVLAPGSEYDRPAEGVTSPANARRGEGSARTDTAPA